MPDVYNKRKLTVNHIGISNGDAPNYPTDKWLHDPDLTAVQGVDQKFWKLDGDSIVPMTAGEQTTVTDAEFSAAKTAKCLAIDNNTNVLIYGGYTYGTVQFSLSITAQVKLEGLMTAIERGIITEPSDFPIPVSALDESQYDIEDIADAQGMFAAAISRMKTIVTRGSELKQDVLDAADQTALDAVVDDRT
jgi:hypothetical protein